MDFESALPNPEYLIKSIAEQGYSLETALADLIDNSISAGADKIEILIDMDKQPFTLFLADNGGGMDEGKLRISMEFPSDSPEHTRGPEDLGRFGLGMKTASFSQTRCFSVISREKGRKNYAGRNWNVDLLKDKGWRMGVNSPSEIDSVLEEYRQRSIGYLNSLEEFEPNTIIVWKGLYKYEDYMEVDGRKAALKRQLDETTCDHLSLVFHRFMEKKNKQLQIRVNNKLLVPFNPFPLSEGDVRKIETRQKSFRTDHIRIEGFVLPSRSVTESKSAVSIWTTRSRGLMDMEGIYVYRGDRIILFGGWNGLIRKRPRLQLARLRVEVGNKVDHLLHLNVAKSQIVIPHDLKPGFESYIEALRTEAEREYFNRGIRRVQGPKIKQTPELFNKVPSNRGLRFELNREFPVLKELESGLTHALRLQLKLLIRMINTTINKLKLTHINENFVELVNDNSFSGGDLLDVLRQLIENGMSADMINSSILPDLGYNLQSLPEEIKELLKE